MKKVSTKKSNKEHGKDEILAIMSELTYSEGRNSLWTTLSYGDKKKRVSVKSQEYIDYIYTEYYKRHGEFISEKDIKDRLKIIRYQNEFENKKETVFQKRCGYKDGCIYIDMVNENLEYIKVSPNGYKILKPKDEKSLFVNDKMQLPMVYPEKTKEDWTKYLDDILNLSDDDKFLYKIFLIACFNPNIRMPIAFFEGKAGLGKSSMLDILADLIDPSKRGKINLDGMSKRDLALLFDHSYFVSIDNVSVISSSDSDFLCQTCTGGNKSYRENYTDEGEVNFNVMARSGLTSVRNCVKKEDLAQRTLFFNIPNLSGKKRITEDDFSLRYEPYKGIIFDGILKTLSLALKIYPLIKKELPTYGRLASFESFGLCIAYFLDRKHGLDRFEKIMKKQHLLQLRWKSEEERRYFETLLEIVQQKPYSGKTIDLYELVNTWIMENPDCPYDESIIISYDVFTKAIHRYEDNIRTLGFDINYRYTTTDNYSAVDIKKIE